MLRFYIHYYLMIKSSWFPELNITVEDCLYVSGKYDWILTFTAPGIKKMKKFCEKLMSKFGEHIMEYEVLETIIPGGKQGIRNPSTKEQVDLIREIDFISQKI